METRGSSTKATKSEVGAEADQWGSRTNEGWDDADTLLGAKATTGSANAYVLTTGLTTALTAYVTGQSFLIIPNFSCTGAATINVDGLGTKNLTKNGTTALASGDLVSGTVYRIAYDGTQFQVLGPLSGVYQPLDATLTALAALPEPRSVTEARPTHLLRRRKGLAAHPSDRLPFTYKTTRWERAIGAPNLLWWAPDGTGNYFQNISLGQDYAEAFLGSNDRSYGFRLVLGWIVSSIAEYGAGPRGVSQGFFGVIQQAALLSMDADTIRYLRKKRELERRTRARPDYEVNALVAADKSGRITVLHSPETAVRHA
ncbi:MAG: hypothetical protein AB7M12_06235 [Hyphomonadaceae bacterium]